MFVSNSILLKFNSVSAWAIFNFSGAFIQNAYICYPHVRLYIIEIIQLCIVTIEPFSDMVSGHRLHEVKLKVLIVKRAVTLAKRGDNVVAIFNFSGAFIQNAYIKTPRQHVLTAA